MIFHKNHICNLYDTIRRWIKPIHKDWNICDFCENFYVVDTIRRQVKPMHKDLKNFICSSCGKSFTQAGNLMKTFMKIKDILNVTLVDNTFLFFIIWEYISKTFMNLKKISNMILVDDLDILVCIVFVFSTGFTMLYNSKKEHFPQTEQKNLK